MSPLFNQMRGAHETAYREYPPEEYGAKRGTLPASMVLRMPVQKPDVPRSQGQWVPSEGAGATVPRATPDWKKLGLDHPPTEAEVFMAAMRQNNPIVSGITSIVRGIQRSPFLQ
jgi:hypothetical protein